MRLSRMNWLASLALTAMLAAMAGAANAQQKRFATGFAMDTEAFRQTLEKVPRFRSFLPESADLSAFLPPIGDQGQQGSCTAWATSYYMRSYYEGVSRGQPLTAAQAFSPAYVYNVTRPSQGVCEGGTSFQQALNVLKTRGAPSIADFPYRYQECARQPDPVVNQVASPYRINNFRSIAESMDDIKGRLAKGHVVAFSMVLPDSFFEFTGPGIYNDLTSAPDPASGHAMLLVGYDDARQAFRLVNSWGKDWGDQGFMWISYEAFRRLKHSGNQFVMDYQGAVPLPSPVRPPVTAPDPKPQPVAKPDFGQIQAQVASLARSVECARITPQIDAGGRVQFTGFAGHEKDVSQLKIAAAALSGVSAVSSSVQIFPWPQCEVLYNFERALAYDRGLKASLQGESTVFSDGDSLAVEVETPNYPSFIYVSYLQASGDAVHLSWPVGVAPKPLPPNTRLTFGGGKGGQPIYRIGKPFGDEIIVVVASATPLLPSVLPRTQDDRDYLSLFRRAFLSVAKDRAGNPMVSAVALPLRTQPKH